MSTTPFELEPKHVRAARALLAWSQKDLAQAASIATSTVADFERGQRTPVANNAQAIRNALEGAGIRFLPTGAVIGPPVPSMASFGNKGTPVRWVTSDDLSEWASRTDGMASFPTLVANLIRGTHGSAINLRFPSDSGIHHAGWDGITETEEESTYVPAGITGWEIGTQRTRIAQKASEDLQKRTSEPGTVDPAISNFVFVTPRHWSKKDEWSQIAMRQGAWKAVYAYDADDLVHWLELAPAVGLWLATRMGNRPGGTRELEEIWEEWSLATTWPLSEELILSDRDDDAKAVLLWLRGDPSVMSLQATTSEEVLAFVHAAISTLPEELSSIYRARILVATTPSAARALANAPGPLIVLLADPEPGLARNLADRGHYVLQAYDDRPVSRGDVRTLARPSRHGIAGALINGGVTEQRANSLARDSARNLAILRRLIPSAPGREPKWAQSPPRALIAALLAGGWEEQSEADKDQIAHLAKEPYESVVSALAPYVGDFDRPIRKVGSGWRVASPQDAWFLLAPYLTDADVSRFEATAFEVLSSADPRFGMSPDERWMADLKGVHRDYSELMRHGIGEVLILMALWGNEARMVNDVSRRVDAFVRRLLVNADEQRWWSLSRNFRLLAEASPGAFLEAIEESLDQEKPPIRSLFATEGTGVFGTEHLSDLLWALESLAWSPELLPRVTRVLARLDAIDSPKTKSGNRPKNSLREIYLLWSPHTYATLDQRLLALDLIRKHQSNSAWKLMMCILPRGHDTSIPTSTPRWRDFSSTKNESITYALIGRGAAAITQRLVEDVGQNAIRWTKLLDRLPDLVPSPEVGIAALESAEPSIEAESDRRKIWAAIRQLLHHHRAYADAEWSMSEQILDRLQAVYDRFAPREALQRISWLFDQAARLPNPSKEGWQGEQRDLELAQVRAAKQVFDEQDVEGIITMASIVDTPGYIGRALYDGKLAEKELNRLVADTVQSENPKVRSVAHGLIISAFREKGETWGEQVIANARDATWSDASVLTILQAFPTNNWTWHQAFLSGHAIENEYWKTIPAFWVSNDDDNLEFAIRKLISADRARHALPLASNRGKSRLPSSLLIELLQASAQHSFDDSTNSNEVTMFQHYVVEVLQALDERDDVESDTLVALEWAYLPVITHSRRPAKAILRVLSEQPALFVELVCAIFGPSEDSGVSEPEPSDLEHARTVASQAYQLLNLWDRLPGTQEDGTIDSRALERWIREARSLAKEKGRSDVADDRIGRVLASAPFGQDGNWPAEAVRDVLDLFRSKYIFDGFRIGKFNLRGVTTRGPRDGGDLERREAERYRTWAKAISLEHPETAKELDKLAETYEHDAVSNDERVERLDWK